MKVNSSPLYSVAYHRNGQDFPDKKALFANWTPDTLDKSLHQKDQEVGIIYTKLRNHTVGEALKETLSDVGPSSLVVVPLLGAMGGIIGAGAEMLGYSGAALAGTLAGAALGASLMGAAGIVEYNGMRTDVGEKNCEFSGYAYRERADQKEVKLIRGWDLDFQQDKQGFISGGAAPTAHGFCEIRSLGLMP